MEYGRFSALTRFSDYHDEKVNPATLGYPGTGGTWSLSSWTGIFFEYPPAAGAHTASTYGSRLSLFSALTKFSDHHTPETVNSNEFFTGQHAVTNNSCGVFAVYVTVTKSVNKFCLGSLPN